jgi:hypothetical protein
MTPELEEPGGAGLEGQLCYGPVSMDVLEEWGTQLRELTCASIVGAREA